MKTAAHEAAELFPGVRIVEPSGAPEGARIWSASLGRGRAVVIERAARAVERTVGMGDAAAGTFKLLLQSSGEALVRHVGRRSRLTPGDMVLLDPARPFRLEMEPAYRQVVLELPRSLVLRHQPSLLGRAGARLDGAEPAHAALFRSLDVIVEKLAQLPPTQQARLQQGVLGLMGSLLGAERLATSTAERRFARACADLEANLTDPELSPGVLARLQGISRRRLDAICAGRGLSLERRIWQRRLERVADELQDPTQAHRSLTDVALSWVFNSVAHFSRAFRARYGQPPSAFRRSRSLGASAVAQAPSPGETAPASTSGGHAPRRARS